MWSREFSDPAKVVPSCVALSQLDRPDVVALACATFFVGPRLSPHSIHLDIAAAEFLGARSPW